MNAPLHVLLVEDNASDVVLFQQMFRREPEGSFTMSHLIRMEDAERRLAQGGVDIVLLDMGLPDARGLDTVRRARAAAPGVPMIVLTGLDDEALADEAMKEGAQDYLIKGQIENRALPRALRYAIERYRMQAEANLIQATQLRYKDEFLSHVSHELRSPLFAIYQFITLLLDNLAGEVKPEQRQYLEIVLRNVRQLQAMIDDLLEVTRIQAGKMTIDLQCASIAEAVHFVVDTLQAVARAKQITLSAELAAGLPPVWADPKRIRQILIILLDNAIKFTPSGGVVQVRAYASGACRFVTIEVADSGCGFSPEMQGRIFERLFQTDGSASTGRKGLGLGLHICKELVTRQGGTIQAAGAEGQGAVFSVALPVFSLANLVAPVFCEQGCGDDCFTLIIAEAGSKVGWLSEEVRLETCLSVRETLQHCLYGDRDLLLPRMAAAGEFELFFLVAATNPSGAEALTARILRRLDDPEHIEYADLTFTITHRVLKNIGRQVAESAHACRDRAAADLQRVMDEEFSKRMAKGV
jgi:signal transduction histidine kinase